MAHEEGDPAEIAKLTGASKYFNTLTTKGRINVSITCNRLNSYEHPMTFQGQRSIEFKKITVVT